MIYCSKFFVALVRDLAGWERKNASDHMKPISRNSTTIFKFKWRIEGTGTPGRLRHGSTVLVAPQGLGYGLEEHRLVNGLCHIA